MASADVRLPAREVVAVGARLAELLGWSGQPRTSALAAQLLELGRMHTKVCACAGGQMHCKVCVEEGRRGQRLEFEMGRIHGKECVCVGGRGHAPFTDGSGLAPP